MAGMMTLGRSPEPLSLILNPGVDFTANLKVKKAGQTAYSWPPGTTLVLAVQTDPKAEEHRWSFQLSGDTASIVVPAAELRPVVARLGPKSRARLYLQYASNDRPILWAAGQVRVSG